MLPTPSTAHWGRYGHYHPDPHYFLGRAPPSTLAGAGAAEAATASAAAAAAPHPPPMSWHHYYYGRGMRRGLGFKRFVWFGLGIAAATWYFRSKEGARRYEIDHGSQATGSPPCGPGWGWSAQRDSLSSMPTTPLPATSPAVVAAPPAPVTASMPSQQDASKSEIVNEARRGWGHRWHRQSRRDAWSEPTASGGAAPASALGTAVDDAIASDADDLQKLKQAVERLWAEKKVEATAAQTRANEKAREYASEKLDKLAAAVETLRETLRTEMPKPERKI